MAESRRVQLTTLSCDVPSSSDKPAAPPKCPSGALQVKEDRPDQPGDTDTVRLVLTLFEPDERSFPEFSYSQLIDNKVNSIKVEVPLSRFEEEEKRENDEAVAIAKRLEEKYGGKPKKKKDRIQDLIDIGYGYDDEDSFIDNSEAYDEFVPASITTKFGGFYVNSGMLQFRQASDTEDTTDEKTPELSKKRKIHGGLEKPQKKPCREGRESNVDPKSSTLSEIGLNDEMKKKKKKKAVGALSVTSMLKKFQREKDKERQEMQKANQRAASIMGAPTIPLCPADAGGGGGSGVTDPLLSLIGSTNDHTLIQAANTVDFDIDLDSLLDVSEGASSSPKLVPQIAAETQLFQPNAEDFTQARPPITKTNSQLKPHSEEVQLLPQNSSMLPHQCAPLPEGLPPGLEDNIQKLMVAAKTSEGESKLKFFTPEINSILLDIELQCREQGGQLRSKVYTHLSSFLPCSRDTLLKRVKKLLVTHMEELPDVEDPMRKEELPDVEDPMHKLKMAIGKAMPEQLARFHETCQVYEQVKTSKAMEEEMEGKPEDNVEEKGGKRGGPKKLFKWNEEIRECLCHVLTVKMERYKKEVKGSQELEEHLKTLLDNEIKPLWPKGWMQSRMLIRESKHILNLVTSLPVKKVRPEKKKQPPVSGPPTTSNGCSVLQGSPPPEGLSEDTDVIFISSSNMSSSVSLGAANKEVSALKKVEGKTRSLANEGSTHVKSNVPPVNATSAPTNSLLNLLADQALSREQPLSVSQEILAAAVAKYKHSVQRWTLGVDTKSPPLPPPPPQSSPVGFPLSGKVCQVVLPKLLQIEDLSRHMDAGQVQIISDDSEVTIQ
ncbi:ubinuclein-1 [Larimichthys crocea]|uniref:ubinuclein-1 n=1 Tax=Larimichthys crocea TaxID=215358 RepID=UPI000F5DA130|nr:ubinuclein-1 [Larimichthys crocea]XP_027139210.1 ubinuclein-1 [Larimichthys crocea]